jgi:hypothetical protein
MAQYWNSAVSWVAAHPGTAILIAGSVFLLILVL